VNTTHNKHSKLVRPEIGNFHRCEWAILGSNCSTIQELANFILMKLQEQFFGGFLDMKHEEENQEEYCGKLIIEHSNACREIKTSKNNPSIPFTDWAAQDYLLINGNHYTAQNQIVIIDQLKEKSLKKRAAQLTNVALLIQTSENQLPEYVKELIPNWQTIQLVHINQKEQIAEFIFHKIKNQIPPLKGLVLAGGKSTRMGEDKSELCWHNKAQKYHVADLLAKYCNDVYISCQAGNIHSIDSNYKVLEDQFLDLGPFGAILTGFRTDPNAAWLVVACDLPLVDSNAIETLIKNRDSSRIATCYFNSETNFPDPLLTIWEPKAYPFLLQYLSQGISCPRKVLINNPINIIDPVVPDLLMNANTQEDRINIEKVIEQRKSESVPPNII